MDNLRYRPEGDQSDDTQLFLERKVEPASNLHLRCVEKAASDLAFVQVEFSGNEVLLATTEASRHTLVDQVAIIGEI